MHPQPQGPSPGHLTQAGSAHVPGSAGWWDRATFLLVSLQVTVWGFFQIWAALSPGLPILTPDSAEYFWNACLFYRDPGWESFWHTSRPLFSLPAILPLLLFELPISYPVVHILGGVFWTVVLVFGFRALGFALGMGRGAVLAALSLLFSGPYFYAFSTVLHADTALAAASLLFFHSVQRTLAADSRGTFRWPVFCGLFFALGLLTKPVFLFVAAMVSLASVSVLVLRAVRAGEFRPRLGFALRRGAVALLTGTFAGCLVVNRNLPQLIQDIHYVNERLGYWVSFEGLWNSLLWPAAVVLLEFPTLPLGILAGSSACLLLATRFRSGQGPDLRAAPESLLALLMTCLLGFAYFMFAVQSKDFRLGFFLFVFLLPAVFASVERVLARTWKQAAGPGFALMALLSTLATLSWTADHPLARICRARFDAVGGEWQTSGPLIRAVTMEDAGVAEALAHVRVYRPEGASAFVPYSGYFFNATQVNGYQLINRSRLPIEITPNWVDSLSVFAEEAPYRYGGFGYPGGFPEHFLQAEFVLFSNANYQFHLAPGPSLYNHLILNRLAEGHPAFWDGLQLIAQFQNRLGHTLYVARRRSPPSPASFFTMIREAAALDGPNHWNIPLILSALHHQPDPLLQEQLESLAQPGRVVPYTLPEEAALRFRELLSNAGFPP